MKKNIVNFTFMALLALSLLSHCASSDSTNESYLGVWEIITSAPEVSQHHYVVFFEDNTFAIYDEMGQMIEKNIMAEISHHSFVGNIVYAAKFHPVPDILGTSTYATYKLIGSDQLILWFYDDDSMNTFYVSFHLDRVIDLSSADFLIEAGAVSDKTDTAINRKNCSSLILVDFDSTMPDRQYSRDGASHDVFYNRDNNDTHFGVLTVPGVNQANQSGLPYASFQIDYQGRLGDVIAGFHAIIPESESEWRTPYVVFAVSIDGDSKPEGWVVGSRQLAPVSNSPGDKTWLEYRLDGDTLVHASGYRENLGNRFTPQNTNPFNSLLEVSLEDGESWADLQVVNIGISAGEWGGAEFEAFVDDIKVCNIRPPENNALLDAAFNGDEHEVRALLDKGINIDYQETQLGVTALMLATAAGHIDIASLLIDSGASINIRDVRGWTALMISIYEGQPDSAAMLLQSGADVNVHDGNLTNALLLASFEGLTEITRLLIEAGANPDAQDDGGWTALIIAAEMNHTEIAILLLDSGSDVNLRDFDGWTALMIASREGNSKMVELLIRERADINSINTYGRTALMIASEKGDIEIVNQLISSDANLTIIDSSGNTALSYAAANGYAKIVRLLIQQGAEVNTHDSSGQTALMLAGFRGDANTTRFLLAAGADVNAKDDEKWTALIWATQEGSYEVAELLVEAGADISAETADGDTAVTIAKQHGFVELSQMLDEESTY